MSASSSTAALRVVTYNVDADTDRNNDGVIDTTDGTFSAAGAASVMTAIGNYGLAGNKQPVDVISVQELYAVPSVTLSAIVSGLNAKYGTGTYAYDPLVGNVSSVGATGNGPNGLIYNTKTVQVLGSQNVGNVSGNGAARAPVRYQLKAINEAGANTFYLYSEHTKAGAANSASGNSTNGIRRAYETDSVRANADALPAGSHVIYTGDFNLNSGSSEAAYQDLLAPAGATLATNGNPSSAAPNLVAGPARGFDPLTTTFTSGDKAYLKYYTESADFLASRLDLQLVTGNALAGSTEAGLQLVANTYTSFGNSYYVNGVLTTANALYGTVDNAANAAATGIPQGVLSTLVSTTDHLPVVADYVIAVPEPGMVAVVGVVIVGLTTRRRPVTSRFGRGTAA